MFRTAQGSRILPQLNAAALPFAGAELIKVVLPPTLPGFWDWSNGWTDDTGSPAPNKGFYWTVPESGVYDLAISINSSLTGGAAGDSARIFVSVFDSETYSAAGVSSGVGTNILDFGLSEIYYQALGVGEGKVVYAGNAYLSEGQEISFNFSVTNVATGAGTAVNLGGTLVGLADFISIRQRLTD